MSNKHTDWDAFADFLEEEINLKVRLKTTTKIDKATFYITNKIQEAAWRATPTLSYKKNAVTLLEIRAKLKEKRKLRRRWQYSRLTEDKTGLNRSARELKALIKSVNHKNLYQKLSKLSARKQDNYSLWKMTKNMKRPQEHVPPLRRADGTWAQKPSIAYIAIA